MSGVFYLAWRYLVWHPFKTTVLIAAITLVIFLPSGLQILIDRTAQDMSARAMTTPLLLGARGSAVELTLNSLYFAQGNLTAVSYEELDVLSRSGLVESIPLYVRFRSRGHALVGTSLDYFEFRGLRITEGRPLVRLGEAVLGAAVAQTQNLQVGDFVVSSPETLFDLAGVYPLKMPVVGILAPNYTSYDQAIFVDLKTSWVISGLGHGHQDLDNPAAAAAVLAVEENRIVANAALVQYNEITGDNRSSFHLSYRKNRHPVPAGYYLLRLNPAIQHRWHLDKYRRLIDNQTGYQWLPAQNPFCHRYIAGQTPDPGASSPTRSAQQRRKHSSLSIH